MTKKKVAAFFTAAALCGALAVGSSMAYLTDHDSVTNKFSVGKVDIVGHEPNYTPDNDGCLCISGCFYPDCKGDYC